MTREPAAKLEELAAETSDPVDSLVLRMLAQTADAIEMLERRLARGNADLTTEDDEPRPH